MEECVTPGLLGFAAVIRALPARLLIGDTFNRPGSPVAPFM